MWLWKTRGFVPAQYTAHNKYPQCKERYAHFIAICPLGNWPNEGKEDYKVTLISRLKRYKVMIVVIISLGHFAKTFTSNIIYITRGQCGI